MCSSISSAFPAFVDSMNRLVDFMERRTSHAQGWR